MAKNHPSLKTDEVRGVPTLRGRGISFQKAFAVNHLNKATKTTSTVIARQSSLTRLGHALTGIWTIVAVLATGSSIGIGQRLEAQMQSLFFALRGPVAPPNNIVILAIDEPSLSVAEQYYRTDPKRYAYLEPLQAWPWKRAVYAQVIERLMAAGARSVAMDILFTSPSSYGAADDAKLAAVLQRYGSRVTLAAEYEQVKMRQGSLTQLALPEPLLQTPQMSIGSINFPLESDGEIHRFASEFPKLLAKKYQKQIDGFDSLQMAMPSFDEAVVAAAGGQGGLGVPSGELGVPSGDKGQGGERGAEEQRGDHIYFYGPPGTFEQISFWNVIDPDNWNTYLKQGKYFKDKIVLIGGTAASLQDFYGVPFAGDWLSPEQMSGVEIHANAIATLLQGQAIRQAIPNDGARSIFVLLFVAGTTVLLTRPKLGLNRFLWAIGIAITWGGISYLSFVHGRLLLPTAVPIVALTLGGFSYLVTGTANDTLKKLQLRRTLERYVSSPVVQQIISQQDDLQDLLHERELATSGKILGGRYKIVKVLGSGGFSETYVAEDIQRPGNPLCVVKQLRPANRNPKHLQLARRLFQLEAETLEKLGTYDQIPQLFAYFEEDEEFYLVQELIVGHPLKQELLPGKPILEAAVIQILQDLLQILEFVHSHNVIHRDIKPSNIIRRYSDGKLVLIDFGAVKQISTQLAEHGEQTIFTIGIGTHGYAPNEQCAGRARFTSDIYAVGMTGIKALTGLDPHELHLDSKTGEFIWTHKTQVSYELAAILSKMVRYDFTQRYQSPSEARADLEELANSSTGSLVIDKLPMNTLSTEDLDTPTVRWVATTTEIAESPSSTSLLPPE